MAYLSILSYSVFQVIVIKIPGYLMRTPHYRLSGPESKRTFCDMNECWYMRQTMHVIKGFLQETDQGMFLELK